MMQHIQQSHLTVAPQAALAYFGRAGALQRLLPPWLDATLASGPPFMPLQPGSRWPLSLRLGPLRQRWELRVRELAPQQGRVELEARGPWASATSILHLAADARGETALSDAVHVTWPRWSPLSGLGQGPVRWRLERLLRYRALRAWRDLQRHARYAGTGTQRIAISGASGLIGRALAAYLDSAGHTVLPMVRGPVPGAPGTIGWDPRGGRVDEAALAGMDAVVHLAGESIAGGRWNAARKAAILDSRSVGTRLLSETLARLPRPPRVLICASAVGFYGNRGAEPIDESAGPGAGFLADVCRTWEAACSPAAAAGIRVAHLRFGMILAAHGGALGAMLPAFRLGLGGPVGHGRQMLSWIALDDALGAVQHALCTPLAGPVNVTAPHPLPQGEFARVLGGVLHRPALLPLPAMMVRMALGEMGQRLLLEGAHVLPARLAAGGFEFVHDRLPEALAAELGLE